MGNNVKMRKECIMELCNESKGVNERINISVLRWYGLLKRMDDSRLFIRL